MKSFIRGQGFYTLAFLAAVTFIIIVVALTGCRGTDDWGDMDADVDGDAYADATPDGCLPVEVCYNCVDDNCDGVIDEGCNCTCTDGGVEICDGMDNDCDGWIDEDIDGGC